MQLANSWAERSSCRQCVGDTVGGVIQDTVGDINRDTLSDNVGDIVYKLMATLVVSEVVSALVVRNGGWLVSSRHFNNAVCEEVRYSVRDRFVY
jgi:hypothetical protein